MESLDLTGRTLGQYVIRRKIGTGGMAQVYLAYQAALDREVAIKVLAPHLAGNPNFVARFQREAMLVAKLLHPNILPVYDYGDDNGILYIVMAYVGGGTLSERMATPLDWQSTVTITGQIADGLDFAHSQGIVHRDLKPANILMGRPDYPLISDFGIARLIEESGLTTTGVPLGTPRYMSPEQAMGYQVDGRSDLYALGVILYELLAGQPPFDGDSGLAVIHQHINVPPVPPSQVRPGVPAALELVALRALAKSPSDRFQTGSAMRTALHSALASPPTPTIVAPHFDATLPPVVDPPLPQQEASRIPIIVGTAVVGALACLVLGALAAFAAFGRDDGPFVRGRPAGAGNRPNLPIASATPRPVTSPTVVSVATATQIAQTPAGAPPTPTIAASGRFPEAEAWAAVEESNRVWAQALENGDTSRLSSVYAGNALREITDSINTMRARGQTRKVEPYEIIRESVRESNGQATIRTRERWKDTVLAANGSVVSTRDPWVFNQVYSVRRINDRWYVVETQIN